MTAASLGTDAITSKALHRDLQLVAQALSSTSLERLAGAIGKDDTQACKIRSGELGAKVGDMVRLLHAAGLRIVPSDRVCVQRQKYDAIVTIAAAAMADPETARRLTSDE